MSRSAVNMRRRTSAADADCRLIVQPRGFRTHISFTAVTTIKAVNPDKGVATIPWLRVVVAAHVVSAAVTTLQRLVVGAQINNFLIFRGSFFHLLRDQDLYARYPQEHFDLFKYSPTWALLFAPFALPPVAVGLMLWNLFNALTLCLALTQLLPPRAAAYALAIAFFEALISIQNAQSNGLVAALMIWACVAAERERMTPGALAVGIGASIKLFPVSAGMFGVFSRRRRVHLLVCAVTGLALLAAPLIVTSPATLLAQYRSWGVVELRDSHDVGMLWIGGVLETITGHALTHWPLQLLGGSWTVMVCVRAYRAWDDARVRRTLLASLLVLSTVFNHQAESPSYVIAFSGLGIWWSVQPRARWRDALVLAALLVGSIAGTDLSPKAWRIEYHQGWRLKAVVGTICWFAIQVDLWRMLRALRRSPGELVGHEGAP